MTDRYSSSEIEDPLEMAQDSAFASYALPETPYGNVEETSAGTLTGSATDLPEDNVTPTAAEEASARKIKSRYDIHLWGTFLFLICFSLVELFSASSQEVKIDNIYGPVVRHAIFLGVGLAIAIGLQRVHFKHFYRWIPVFVIGSMLMMLLVLFCGVKINGTMRGLSFAGFTILPAEFLKLSSVLGVALILSRNQVKGKRDVTKAGAIGATVLMLVCAGLLVSQGLSNALLIIAMCYSMMIISGMKWKKLGYVALAIVICGLLGYGAKSMFGPKAVVTDEQKEIAMLNHEEGELEAVESGRMSTWQARLTRFFRSDKYSEEITEENRQEMLSFIAQAHGGLKGVGIGNSREASRLPLAFSDYIYAIIIEEWGMVFGLFILLCYLWMLARAGTIGAKCSSTFACLIVCGCAVFIVFQALYHMAIVTGCAPVSGQPLPLISKGGTSIIVSCMAIGCMLSVSRHAAFKGDLVARKKEFAALPESIRNDNPAQL